MKFRKRLLLYSALLVVVLGVVSAPVGSQTPPLAKLAFDVVSIKPSTAGTRTQLKVEPGGRFVADGVPLALLVAIAYHLQAYQMVGADGWLMNDHWSVEAKTADGTVDPPSANPPYMGVPDRMVLRLQSLLADRFDLKTHREMHEMQVWPRNHRGIGHLNGPDYCAAESRHELSRDRQDGSHGLFQRAFAIRSCKHAARHGRASVARRP